MTVSELYGEKPDGIKRPLLGMLCWEKAFPGTLKQLGKLPGSLGHPATFDFPLRYERVRGANIHTIIEEPSLDALHAMINAARSI